MAIDEEPEWVRRGPPVVEERPARALRVVVPSEKARLTYRTGREIRTKPVVWEWDQRFPGGELNLVDAPPSKYKTTAVLKLAAMASRGDHLPGDDRPREPKTVIMFSPEEDVGMSGLPKFQASGGVRERFVEVIRDARTDVPQMVFPAGAGLLDEFLTELRSEEHHLGWLVLDGISVILESGKSEHDGNEVKAALTALLSVTRKHGVTVIGIRHVGKGAHPRAADWGIGSVAWGGMARSQWIVLSHPDQEGRFILAPLKYAYAQRQPSSLIFAPRSQDVVLDDGSTQSFGTVEFVDESELDGQKWVDRIGRKAKRKATKEELDAAQAFLRAFLADGVMRPFALVQEEAKARAGIAKGVLWLAAQELKKERLLRFDRDQAAAGDDKPWVVSIPLARLALSSES